MKKNISLFLLILTLCSPILICMLLSPTSYAISSTSAPTDGTHAPSDGLPSERNSSGRASEAFWENVCFFGDSTTYGLLVYNVRNNGSRIKNYRTLKESQIWVPQNGTFYLINLFSAEIALSSGESLVFADAAALKRPSVLILTVGVNGLCSWEEQTFKKYYTKMIEQVQNGSPETTIILQSIYPTARNISGKLKNFTNDKIDRLNGWIREIANNYDLMFLNTASALKDEEGYLFTEYQNGDGLHLNTRGFNAILEYIDKNVGM